MNIEDARFLFSALIQALPTMISLSLIAIFWLRPERGLFKRFFTHIYVLIFLFYIAIVGDIIILTNLEGFIKSDLTLYYGLGISCAAIIFLIYFLIMYIFVAKKSLKNNEKPNEQSSIEILNCRYAKGEITIEQFNQMKKDLSYMQKDTEQNESYNVSISDWITILQDKTSTHTNLFLFLASAIIGMIIVVPQLVRDSMGSNLYASIMLVALLGLLYLVFRLMSRKSKQISKPYEELYKKVILGEITDSKKIRDEYKKIKDNVEGF